MRSVFFHECKIDHIKRWCAFPPPSFHLMEKKRIHLRIIEEKKTLRSQSSPTNQGCSSKISLSEGWSGRIQAASVLIYSWGSGGWLRFPSVTAPSLGVGGNLDQFIRSPGDSVKSRILMMVSGFRSSHMIQEPHLDFLDHLANLP